jgi:hypothetical protein
MSDKDKHPAQDTARPIYPVSFFGTDSQDPTITDWRAQVLPADAPEEEPAPKASSAPEPAVSSESLTENGPPAPVPPAPAPAEKDNTPPKVPSPGSPTSSAPKAPGKSGPPAATKTP